MNPLNTYQLEKKYLDLIDMVALYNIDVSEHKVPTYVMDRLEEYVRTLNDQLEEKAFRIERSPTKLDDRLYEVFKLQNVGEITLFGRNIPVPSGYEVVEESAEEESDNDE